MLACAALAAAVQAQEKPPPIVGTIVDEDGTPAAGIDVVARWRPRPELPRSIGWSIDGLVVESRARSDERGRFRIGVTTRVPCVVTAHAGERMAAQVFPVLPGEVVRLKLERAFAFEGRVVDARGIAVRGADVRLELAYGSIFARADDYAYAPQLRTVESGEDGRFALPYEPGYLRQAMWACLPGILAQTGDGRSSGRPITVRPVAFDRERELRLEAPARVVFTVTGDGGKPLAGATLFDPALPHVRIVADAHGRIATPFLGGVPWIAAAGHEPKRVGAPAQIDGNEVAVVLEVATPREIAKVTPQDAGARVLISIEGAEGADGLPLESVTTVAADGRVIVAELPRGALFTAWIERDGAFLPLAAGAIEDGGGIATVSPARRIVRGQVLDPEGVPAAHARVVLQVDGWPRDATWTDRAGRFDCESMPPGPLRIAAVLDGKGVGTVEPAADANGELRVMLARGRYLEGVVEDEAGRAVPGAWVSSLESGGDELLGIDGVAAGYRAQVVFADDAGRFAFASLHEENVSLIVNVIRDGQRFQANASATSTPVLGDELLRVKLVPVTR